MGSPWVFVVPFTGVLENLSLAGVAFASTGTPKLLPSCEVGLWKVISGLLLDHGRL
jgi:hypothetical protein